MAKKSASPKVGLIDPAKKSDLFLFHTPDGDAYARIDTQAHTETWAIGSANFKEWCAKQFFDLHQQAPSADLVAQGLAVLTGEAKYGPNCRPVYVRMAETNGSVWLDLVNENWQVVEITAKGWEVVESGAAATFFRRSRGSRTIPLPVRGSKGEGFVRLKRLLHYGSEDNWVLMMSWLLSTFMAGGGTFPVLLLTGESGSGKSTTTQILRNIVDPNVAPLRRMPTSDRDAMIAAINGWVVALNNVSRLTNDQSDMLCCLSSRSGFGTRALYTDEEEKVLDAARPLILNGIDDFVTRDDLLRRTLLVSLPPMPDEVRLTEREVQVEFEALWPMVLGELFDAVSGALGARDSDEVPARLESLADFSDWIQGAEEALGLWDKGHFVEVYRRNRRMAHDSLIEGIPFAAPLMVILGPRRVIECTSFELMGQLRSVADMEHIRHKDWPATPNELISGLRRAASALTTIGVRLEVTPNRRIRLWIEDQS